MATTAPHGGEGSDSCAHGGDNEQQSVVALSAAAHHSFDKVAAGEKYDGPRAQKTDRAEEAAHKAPRRQRSNAAGDAVLFELFDEDTAGMRPGDLAEPRPQERLQRHTMEHIVDYVCSAPTVQILDAPVPQMVEQLPDVLRFFDRLSTVPEQVIEVPKILPEDVPFRAVLRDTQLVEELVEVPTIVSFSSQQRTVEQNVDIPVVGGSGAGGGLSGFLAGQVFSVTAEQSQELVEVFKVYTVDRVQQRFWSRSLCPQIQVEVFKIFYQSRVPQRLPRFLLARQVDENCGGLWPSPLLGLGHAC